jgi:hypothetical protein
VFSFSASPFGVVAAMDALAALAAIDSTAARAQLGTIKFPTNVTRTILQRTRVGSVERFPNDLLRLELALSQLSTAPQDAFTVLDSFDRAFWEAAATVAFRWSGLGSPYAENSGPIRIVDQLRRVRSEWPSAARRLCATDPAGCRRALGRFRQVAEWLDLAAIDRIANEDTSRAVWAAYLPFSLTASAEAFAPSDPAAASEAITRSVDLALKLPSPSREWALAWNAVAWKRIGTEAAARATTQALERVRQLPPRAGGRSWWEWSPRLIQQVAQVDAAAAYALARESHPTVRGAALAAVASAMMSPIPSVVPPR